MAWQGLQGHDDVVEIFRRSLQQDRLASTYLFAGPAGVGKRSFAEKLALALLCQQQSAAEMAPCCLCNACTQVLAGTHPDVLTISKPADRSFIPLSQIVGEAGHRMREGLCHAIALKPFMGGRKVALVDDADHLNEEGANALLKTLEEPPADAVLILIGTSADKQLPTIRSRCQIVRFRPLATEIVAELLLAQGLAGDEEEALRLAQFSEGSLTRAAELADPELWAFRRELLGQLPQISDHGVAVARSLTAFVDAAGKEAGARRNRARQVIGFASEFYRQTLRAQCGVETAGDAILRQAVEHRTLSAEPDGVECTLARLDRCLEALGHIDRNANQATLIECWIDDLSR